MECEIRKRRAQWNSVHRAAGTIHCGRDPRRDEYVATDKQPHKQEKVNVGERDRSIG